MTTGRQFLAAWPAMREIIAGRPLPVASLDRRVGPDRALALIRGKLEPAKRSPIPPTRRSMMSF